MTSFHHTRDPFPRLRVAMVHSLLSLAVVTLLAGAGASAASGGSVAPPQVSLSLPLARGGQLVKLFDPPEQRWLPGHRGVDLTAEVYQEVLSPSAGIITFSGWVVNRPVVTVTHADGLRSSFEPVTSELVPGTLVRAGEGIGTISPDASHCRSTCLHWGLRSAKPSDHYLDPLSFIPGGGPITLLPLLP